MNAAEIATRIVESVPRNESGGIKFEPFYRNVLAEVEFLTKEAVKAVNAETERILGIVAEEASHYSKTRESLVPAEIAIVFANAVVAKVGARAHESAQR